MRPQDWQSWGTQLSHVNPIIITVHHEKYFGWKMGLLQHLTPFFFSFCFCFWALVLTHELCFLSLHHSASAVPLTSILSLPLNTRLCLSHSLISQDSSLPVLCPMVFGWLLPYLHSPLTLVLPLLVTEKTKLILVSNQFCFCLRGKMLQEVVAPNLTIRKNHNNNKKKTTYVCLIQELESQWNQQTDYGGW